MKQIVLNAYGGSENLSTVDTEIPQPNGGEVLVKVEAIGVNYSDVLRRKNTYFMPTPLPFVLGAEVIGTVIEINGETDLKPNQRVLAILPSGGGYSEYVTVHAQYCVPLPPSIDAAQATAIFVQGSTAHLMLHRLAGDISGKTVLIHAAAGGVGSILTQLAKQSGAKVIGAGSSDKLDRMLAFGADEAVDYTQANWTEEVIRHNEGEKVDLIFEMVGGKVFEQSLSCLTTMGTIIVYGAASGQKGNIHSEHFVDQSHRLLSFNLAHFIQFRMEEWQASLGAVIGLLAEGKLQIDTTNQFPLEDAHLAHDAIEKRSSVGKVVLIP